MTGEEGTGAVLVPAMVTGGVSGETGRAVAPGAATGVDGGVRPGIVPSPDLKAGSE